MNQYISHHNTGNYTRIITFWDSCYIPETNCSLISDDRIDYFLIKW